MAAGKRSELTRRQRLAIERLARAVRVAEFDAGVAHGADVDSPETARAVRKSDTAWRRLVHYLDRLDARS